MGQRLFYMNSHFFSVIKAANPPWLWLQTRSHIFRHKNSSSRSDTHTHTHTHAHTHTHTRYSQINAGIKLFYPADPFVQRCYPCMFWKHKSIRRHESMSLFNLNSQRINHTRHKDNGQHILIIVLRLSLQNAQKYNICPLQGPFRLKTHHTIQTKLLTMSLMNIVQSRFLHRTDPPKTKHPFEVIRRLN